jgi:hypothetical protein
VKLGWFRLQLNKETALNAFGAKLTPFEAALETAPAKLTGAAG